jgi:hypothetical protein
VTAVPAATCDRSTPVPANETALLVASMAAPTTVTAQGDDASAWGLADDARHVT